MSDVYKQAPGPGELKEGTNQHKVENHMRGSGNRCAEDSRKRQNLQIDQPHHRHAAMSNHRRQIRAEQQIQQKCRGNAGQHRAGGASTRLKQQHNEQRAHHDVQIADGIHPRNSLGDALRLREQITVAGNIGHQQQQIETRQAFIACPPLAIGSGQ